MRGEQNHGSVPVLYLFFCCFATKCSELRRWGSSFFQLNGDEESVFLLALTGQGEGVHSYTCDWMAPWKCGGLNAYVTCLDYKEAREKERCLIYKEGKEIYIVQEIDVCSLVPFLFSFSSMKLPIFVSIPLSNVNISLRGLALDPVHFLGFRFVVFSPQMFELQMISYVFQKRVLEMIWCVQRVWSVSQIHYPFSVIRHCCIMWYTN